MFSRFHNRCKKKIWPKTPYNYPGPLWSYIFSICGWEKPQAPHFYDSLIFERAPFPQSNYPYLWGRQFMDISRKDMVKSSVVLVWSILAS